MIVMQMKSCVATIHHPKDRDHCEYHHNIEAYTAPCRKIMEAPKELYNSYSLLVIRKIFCECS